jgi:hypothetical protein
VTFVVKSIDPATAAEALAGVWDRAAGDRVLL